MNRKPKGQRWLNHVPVLSRILIGAGPRTSYLASGAFCASFAPMLILHDPRCADYGSSAAPRAARARHPHGCSHLRDAHPDWTWRTTAESNVTDDVLLLAHTPAHLKRLSARTRFRSRHAVFPRHRGSCAPVASRAVSTRHGMRSSTARRCFRSCGRRVTTPRRVRPWDSVT